MLAGALEARRQPQQRVRSSTPGAARPTTSFGLPSVSVPVLSTTSVSTFSSTSIASALRNSTPASRAAPGRHHDRHRRGQAERARAGDDQHGDRVDERVGQPRLGPEHGPDDERQRSRRRSPRHEPGGDPSASRWIGARLRCASPTMRDDLREQRVRADALGPHHERAGAVDGAARSPVARLLLDRDRLAGDHRLVDGRSPPRCTDAVHRAPSRRGGRAAGRRPGPGRAARPPRCRRPRCAAPSSARGRAALRIAAPVRLRARAAPAPGRAAPA